MYLLQLQDMQCAANDVTCGPFIIKLAAALASPCRQAMRPGSGPWYLELCCTWQMPTTNDRLRSYDVLCCAVLRVSVVRGGASCSSCSTLLLCALVRIVRLAMVSQNIRALLGIEFSTTRLLISCFTTAHMCARTHASAQVTMHACMHVFLHGLLRSGARAAAVLFTTAPPLLSSTVNVTNVPMRHRVHATATCTPPLPSTAISGRMLAPIPCPHAPSRSVT